MVAEELRNRLRVRSDWPTFRHSFSDLEGKLSCAFKTFLSLRCGKLVNQTSEHAIEILQVSSMSINRVDELLV